MRVYKKKVYGIKGRVSKYELCKYPIFHYKGDDGTQSKKQ